MSDLSERIKRARDAGYSDADIRARLDDLPEIRRARDAGYSDEAIFGRLGLAVETARAPETPPGGRGEVSFLEDLPKRAGRKILHAAERLGASPEEIMAGVGTAVENLPESAIGLGGQAYDLANLAITPGEWPRVAGAAVEAVKRAPGAIAQGLMSPEDVIANAASYAVKDPLGAAATVSSLTGGVGAFMRPGNALARISQVTNPLALPELAARGVGAAGERFLSPLVTQAGAERAAGNQFRASIMGNPADVTAALRREPESLLGQVPASQRLAEAGLFEPVLGTMEGDLRTGLTQTGRQGVIREQERLVAIQAQLNAVEQQIRQQGALLTPEAAANLGRVRSDLLQSYNQELSALQKRMGATGASMPATGQLEPGAAIAARAGEMRDVFRKQEVRPRYEAAFRAAGNAETVDITNVLSDAERILQRPLSFYDPRTAPKVARRLARVEREATPSGALEPVVVSLEEADAIRKAINTEIASANAAAPGSPLSHRLSQLHHSLDTAIQNSGLSDVAKTAYQDALNFYRENYVPRFRTGVAYDLLRTTKKNQTGLLTGDTVARILSKEENAAQFAAMFQGDDIAREAMETGIRDLARREVIDATTRAVNPQAIDKFLFDHAEQLRLMGIDGEALLGPVRQEADALRRGYAQLEREAAFTRDGDRAVQSAKQLVDRLVSDPAAMDAARRRLSEEGRQALTREVVDRTVQLINGSDPQKAIDYLTKNATSVGMVLDRADIAQLTSLADKQKLLHEVRAGAIEPTLKNMSVDLSAVDPDKLTDLGLAAREMQRIKNAESLMGFRPSDKMKEIGAAEIERIREKKPAYIDSKLTLLDKLMKTFGEVINKKTLAVMADALINNPGKVADLIEAADARKARPLLPPESRLKVGGRAALMGGISAQNAAAQQPNQNAMAR